MRGGHIVILFCFGLLQGQFFAKKNRKIRRKFSKTDATPFAMLLERNKLMAQKF